MTDSPYEMLRADPDLGPLVDAHGELTLDPADDLFESLEQSIVLDELD